MVKFVSYTGKNPCFCSGVLTLEIDGVIVIFQAGLLISGGDVFFDNENNEYVTKKSGK